MTPLFAQAEGFSFEGLIQTVVVLLFFLAPALKGIFQSRKQAREAPREVDTDSEKRALEKWERMMRGEVEVEVEPDIPDYPVLDPVEEPPPPPPRAAPERLVRPESVLEPVADEGRLESEPVLPGPLVGRSTPLSDALPSTAGASLPTRGDRLSARLVEADVDGRMADGASQAALTRRGQRAAAPRKRRVDWRRAVVLSEFLSTPLAMRRDAPWTGR